MLFLCQQIQHIPIIFKTDKGRYYESVYILTNYKVLLVGRTIHLRNLEKDITLQGIASKHFTLLKLCLLELTRERKQVFLKPNWHFPHYLNLCPL